MLVSLDWLNSYVNLSDWSLEEIEACLLEFGIEVEGSRVVGLNADAIQGLSIMHVDKIEEHVAICSHETTIKRVSVHSKWLTEGDFVVYAPEGFAYPSGRVSPEGGELIKREYLLTEAKSTDVLILGTHITEAQTTFRDAVVQDTILDVQPTANRADCQSVLGLARELSAAFERPFLAPPTYEAPASLDAPPIATVQDKTACSRYVLCRVEGLQITDSPEFVRRRLEACGIRSINNVVDAGNYVLLEIGQPMHAFDADKVEGGKAKVEVRRARAGETLVLLDENQIHLSTEDLVIADSHGPLALAGIMGGAESQVRSNTSTILIESALFDAKSVRRSSKRHRIQSESSYRFERGIDPLLTDEAISLFLRVLWQSSPSIRVSELSDFYPRVFRDRVLNLPLALVQKVLGIEIASDTVHTALKRLHFSVAAEREGVFEVRVPSFRLDVTRPIDLVEEVFRVYGCNQLSSRFRRPLVKPEKLAQGLPWKWRLRDVLRPRGFSEVYTPTFTNLKTLQYAFGAEFQATEEPAIEVMDPINHQMTHLRTHLGLSMLPVLRQNQRSFHEGGMRFFEIGKVFWRKERYYWEREHVACLMMEPGLNYERAFAEVIAVLQYMGCWSAMKLKRPKNYLASILHPKNSIAMYQGEICVGSFGELHPSIARAEDLGKWPLFVWEWEIDTPPLQPLAFRVQETPHFPPVRRDMAVLVDRELLASEVLASLRVLHPFLISVEILDIFEGEPLASGVKSVSFSLTFLDPTRTMMDAEVNALFDQALRHLETTFNAKLR